MACAPMPFLIGVMAPHMTQVLPEADLQSSIQLWQVANMPLEDVVVVDLDQGTIRKSRGCVLAQLPGRSKLQLQASLDQVSIVFAGKAQGCCVCLAA